VTLQEIFAGRWSWVGLLVALVCVAFLVNRFAPKQRRHRLRRAAILFVVLTILEVSELTLSRLHLGGAWLPRIQFGVALISAFTAINIGALVVFDLLLPFFSISLAALASDLVVGAAYLVATIGLMRDRGIDLTSVLATSAVVSAVLALSLQSTLGNVIGGVALQVDGSIHVGDWIQLENGRQGKVKQIGWRHTVVETRDWGTLVVPNATLLAGQILVLGKREGQPAQHRMWVYFNVDFRFPPSRVITVVNEALWNAPITNVAAEPKPNCVCMDFASPGKDSFAYYAVRYWLTDLAVDDPTSSKVRERIHTALRRADIPLARPAQTAFVTQGGDQEQQSKLSRHRELRRSALRGMTLFKTLTQDELEQLVDRLKFAPFAQGELVTRKGAVAHWLYILIAGTVEISVPAEEKHPRTIIARIDAPGFFGEMGMMTGEPRRADVHAVTDVDCYRLDKEGFGRIVQDRPEIAKEMSTTLARRRVELLQATEHVEDVAQRETMEAAEILEGIRTFFGL
jgi:small-conductance mechanosensitive channel/CRP-like cAMP-binding protein